MDEAIPEPVRIAWQHALDGWEHQERHDLFIAQVAQHNCYAWAAARYKQKGDAIATRQLARLRETATATLLAGATTRPKPSEQPYRSPIAVLLAVAVAVICGR